MVRLLHTSDWHLGRILYGKSLLEDQSFALDRFLDELEAAGISPLSLIVSVPLTGMSAPLDDRTSSFVGALVRTWAGFPQAIIESKRNDALEMVLRTTALTRAPWTSIVIRRPHSTSRAGKVTSNGPVPQRCPYVKRCSDAVSQ